jgi:hypothetical protein
MSLVETGLPFAWSSEPENVKKKVYFFYSTFDAGIIVFEVFLESLGSRLEHKVIKIIYNNNIVL